MIREVLKVTRADQDYLWLENTPKSACGGCAQGGSCGVSSIAKAFNFKKNELRFPNSCNAQKNDWVEVVVKDSDLLKASVITYLLPIIFLLLGSVLFQLLLSNELFTLVGGFTGLFFAFYLLRHLPSSFLDVSIAKAINVQ